MSTAKTKRKACEPRPLQEELDRRAGCRYGLADVLVVVGRLDGFRRVYGTMWNKDSELEVAVYPDGPRPNDVRCVCEPAIRRLNEQYKNKMECHSLDCFFHPESVVDGIQARDVTLLERWPGVCCKPRWMADQE